VRRLENSNVGTYSEYLDRNLNFPDLVKERKSQLARIVAARGGRDVLVFAASLDKPSNLTSIQYSDLLPIQDQLSNLQGQAVDLILETPGGSGEVAEDIVKMLHAKYQDVAVVVPGWAKSAGTIMAMGCDEILMEPASALGPIDAQIIREGKVFSADALIEGMEKIKAEADTTGKLNRAYIPMLQVLSPGELQAAENALKFAQDLVTKWLVTYKFKNWTAHRTTNPGTPVTDEEKEAKAKEIGHKLCDHRRWLTHSRSIKIADLREMGLEITDYSLHPNLADPIRRYYALLQMTLSGNVYKVFETPSSQIYRATAMVAATPGAPSPQARGSASAATINVDCGTCGTRSVIQANFEKTPLEPGAIPFPANNQFQCPKCGFSMDLAGIRRQIEAQAGRRVI
jgi:hypothetical protein